MTCHREINRELLTGAISIVTDQRELTFPAARKLADQEAAKHSSDPMLLAWYDGKTGAFSPRVE